MFVTAGACWPSENSAHPHNAVTMSWGQNSYSDNAVLTKCIFRTVKKINCHNLQIIALKRFNSVTYLALLSSSLSWRSVHNQSFSTKTVQAVFEVKCNCYLLFKSEICLCIIILVDSVDLRPEETSSLMTSSDGARWR